VYSGYTDQAKKLLILQKGVLTKAVLKDSEPTGVRINDKSQYRMIFGYEAAGEPYSITIKTVNMEYLEDEDFEWLVYQEDAPQNAVLVDDLPPAFRMKILGHFGEL